LIVLRALGGVVLCASASAIAPVSASAVLISDYTQIGSEPVVSGVVHAWGNTQTDTANQSVNVLTVAHDAEALRLEVGLANGRINSRRRTSLQAADYTSSGHRVVAAVNGDFWQTNDDGVRNSAGLTVRNGELISSFSTTDWDAFGVRDDGSSIIGTPQLGVTVGLPGGVTATASAVNKFRRADFLVVFSSRFGPSTRTDATGIEVRLTTTALPLQPTGTYNTTVAEVRPSAGDTPIGANELVLSAEGTAASALEGLAVGDAVTVSTAVDPDWAEVRNALGGNLIIKDGEPLDLSLEKYTLPNPRTALGVTESGDVVLATVDGRSETSGGMALADLADLMRSFGVMNALNLDGGGSTTMVVDPEGDAPLSVVNDPSDGDERAVNTTLQIVSTVPEPLAVSAPRTSIVPNVAAGKTDAAVRLSWQVTGGAAASTQLQRKGMDGLWHDVTLDRPDQTSITRRFGFGASQQFRVRVTDGAGNISPWSVSPTYVLKRFNENDGAISRVGTWISRYKSTAIGNHFGRSTYSEAPKQLSLTYTGIEVAMVAQKSAMAGLATITVGGTSAQVSLNSASVRPRIVVFVKPLAGSAVVVPQQNTISVTNSASAARPYVDVDAFLVLTLK
jgi:exopolysaccharide biosynthesis protein